MRKEKIKKIAIFRALNVGDMLCSIPAVRALRKKYPNARISLISLPWARDLIVRFDKYFDEFIEFPGYPGLLEREVDWAGLSNFSAAVKKEKFDLFFQMHGDGTVINPFIERITDNIVGFYKKGDIKPNFKKAVTYPENLHEIHRCLSLVEEVTKQNETDDIEFKIMDYEAKFASLLSNFHKFSKNYIVIHPGGSTKEKWLDEKTLCRIGNFFAELGFQIILTGTSNEKLLCRNISEKLKVKAVNLAGTTTIGVMAEVIKKSKLFVTNDTGVAHIASAFKTPYIVIFNGYSDPTRWAPIHNSLTKIVMPSEAQNSRKIIHLGLDLLSTKSENIQRIYGAIQ